MIGNDCVIGHNAHLEGCTIEDKALVGSGSIVLHRAVVRSGGLVGAGAVVSGGMEVPSKAMALGIPAKIKLDSVTPEFIQLAVGRLHRERQALPDRAPAARLEQCCAAPCGRS